MREEILRLDYVGTPHGRAGCLRDATFGIFAGELVALAGRPSSGAAELLQLLARERSDYTGSIRLGEEELSTFPGAFNAGVYVISPRYLQYEKVCLFDRLCLSSGAKALCSVVDRRGVERKFRRVQEELGLSHLRFDLAGRFSALSRGDRVLFELIRARLMQCRLLVLSGIFAQCSVEECEQIAQVLRCMLAQGVSAVYSYDEHFPVLARLTGRVVVMRHGSVARILYPEGAEGSFDIDTLHYAIIGRKVRLGDAPHRVQAEAGDGSALELVDSKGQRILEARAGEIWGIHDALGEIPYVAHDFLEFLSRQCTLRRGAKLLEPCNVRLLVRQRVAIISPVPEKELFKNLPPWENVSMLARFRYRRPRFNRRVGRYLFRSVVARYSYLEQCGDLLERDNCYGLSEERLKELVAAKWLAAEPEVVVLFALTDTTFPNEQERARQFYRQLAEEGKTVFVISSNSQYLQRTCGVVIEYANHTVRALS